MKRGAVKKADSTLINFYAPDRLVEMVEQAVVELDTDKSKFIRGAIREKLIRHRIKPPEEVPA